MKSKKMAFAIVFVLICGLLSACGTSKEPEEYTEQLPINYENLMTRWGKQETGEDVTCWYSDEDDKAWLEIAAKQFESEYSVKVNIVYYDGVSMFEDMNRLNQIGEGPDVYLMGNDQLQLAIESGMAEENTWFDDAFWKNNYPAVAKNAVTYQNKQFGYPVYFDTYCLVYDANLLENAPASIDDILAFLDEYEDTGSTKAIFRWDVADPYINTMFIASSANLFGENGDSPTEFKVNDEKSVAAMEYFQSLSAYLWMNKDNISHDTVMNRIKDGTLVLGLCKSDMLPMLYEMQVGVADGDTEGDTTDNQIAEDEETGNQETGEETTNYKISYVPSLTQEMASTTFSTTYGAYVNPYGKNTVAGNMFALYLSYDCASGQYAGNGKLPVINQKDAFDEMQSIVYAQYLNSKPIPKVMLLGDYLTESAITFDAIWEGKNAQEQLDILQQTMEEKLK